MKRIESTVVVVTYASDLHPQIVTSAEYAEHFAPIIEWGDANPIAWDIVMHNRSAPFGKKSSTYLGCDRGDDPRSVLARLDRYRRELGREDALTGVDGADFWSWRARFTLQHYRDKGFRGGLFQQFDGQYDRGCCALDYTPATLDEVIARFRTWCDVGYRFDTRAIKINGKTNREYAAEEVRV